jgi:hypothetical protein
MEMDLWGNNESSAFVLLPALTRMTKSELKEGRDATRPYALPPKMKSRDF